MPNDRLLIEPPIGAVALKEKSGRYSPGLNGVRIVNNFEYLSFNLKMVEFRSIIFLTIFLSIKLISGMEILSRTQSAWDPRLGIYCMVIPLLNFLPV
jgi:hypothetical protein